jgi:mannose-6-phosphate isomerase-like protein (cupin superfamily)
MEGMIQIQSKEKDTIFEEIGALLGKQGFAIDRSDFERPWGGFFVIVEEQSAEFVSTYFPGMSSQDLIGGRKVSPKILVVVPEKRLSWQYHHRRSEVWRVVGGEVGIKRSPTDEEGELKTYKEGDVVTLECGERHRLIGLENFGFVAEIWQHTDPDHPSDEDDIVRVQDDFARK